MKNPLALTSVYSAALMHVQAWQIWTDASSAHVRAILILQISVGLLNLVLIIVKYGP